MRKLESEIEKLQAEITALKEGKKGIQAELDLVKKSYQTKSLAVKKAVDEKKVSLQKNSEA